MGALNTILEGLRIAIPSFATSDGSIEAKMIDVVSAYADSEAVERSNALTTIQTALATQKVTSKDYYRNKASEFQSGDNLIFDPLSQYPMYEVVDLDKRIVKQAYIGGTFPSFVMFVNKLDADQNLAPLSAEEFAGFADYFAAFQPIGLSIQLESAEVAKVYDAGVVVYVQAGTDVEAATVAVNEALKTYQTTLRTNNTVSLSEIENVMQSVDGVTAIGWDKPYVNETFGDGSVQTKFFSKGIVQLLSGAFTFATELTVANFKTI